MKPTPTILSPGQRQLVFQLQPILQLATCGVRSSLPLKPRTNTLIVGPSGSGKTHIVRELASRAKIGIWHENVSNWLPLGARGETPTIVSLVRWLTANDRGIIFLDECDKLNSPNEFSNSIRNEVFSLLDYRLPDGAITVPESSDIDPFGGQLDQATRKTVIRTLAEEKLKNRILIVAAGAWQSCWEQKRYTIGFHDEATQLGGIERTSLLPSIAPELLQRFRSEILFLTPMKEQDYLEVMAAQIGLVPNAYQLLYEVMIRQAIPAAVEHGLGMRMFEEIYAQFCTRLLQDCCYDEFVFKQILLR